jgi:hypothetical protein
MFAICSEPGVSGLVMHVEWIEQRYQHVNVQKRDHVELCLVPEPIHDLWGDQSRPFGNRQNRHAVSLL